MTWVMEKEGTRESGSKKGTFSASNNGLIDEKHGHRIEQEEL
jgi:hypothetical protein